MNRAVLGTACLGVARLGTADMHGTGVGYGLGGGGSCLPKEYQQVEYIESTGTQWIDTQIKYKSNMSFDVQFMELAIPYPVIANNRTHIFGCHNGNNRVRLRRIEPNVLYILYGNNGEYKNVTQPLTNSMLNNVYNVHFSPTNIKIKRNDVLINNWDISNDNIKDVDDNITLFYHTIDPTNKFIGRFYFVKIYEENTLVLNLVPCYRKSDNEIGMYDTVNKVFYVNQGTGTFSKGRDTGTFIVIDDSGNAITDSYGNIIIETCNNI